MASLCLYLSCMLFNPIPLQTLDERSRMSKDAQLDPKTIQVANYPSRKLILVKLKSGPVSEPSLQKAVRMSQKVFESHLGQLRDEGLVRAEKGTIQLTNKGKEILGYVEKLDQENIDWT